MHTSTRQQTLILLMFVIVALLMGMGIDLYVPSLPTISGYFHTTRHSVQLTISLYMLGYGVGQLVFGVLSDHLGRRKILLGGAVSYFLISLLSAHAPNIEALVIYRLLQGIGIAGMGISVRAMTVDCFSGLRLTKAITYGSTSWAIGPIIGPFLGSYIQHYINWQADFYFFAVFSLIIIVFAVVAIPETNQNLRPLRINTIWCMVKTVTSNRDFILGSIFISLIYSSIVIFNLIGPFMIQVVLKYSVIAYGHIALLLGLAYFIGNICNRLLIQYFNPLKISLLAIIGSLILASLMAVLAAETAINIYSLTVPVFAIFVLCGLIFPTMAAHFLGLFPKLAGTANAVYGSIMACGVFVITTWATVLKTTTQLPLAVVYILLLFFALILFVLSTKRQGAA